jgi:hypothetical protein
MDKKTDTNLSPEAQARINFVRSVVPRRKPRYLIKTASLLVVALIIVGLILLLGSSGNHKVKPKVTKSTTSQAASLTTNIPLASYTSQFFGLSLRYPTTWAVKDSGQGLLQLTSPLTNLTAADGKSVKGQIVFTASKPGTLPAGLTAGTNLAVLDSTVAVYTSPTSDQSGQTYLSFVQYSTTSIKGGLDGVYVTGNYGYQKDQVVPTSDISNVSPLIYISFNQCKNKQCTTFTPLTIASSSWTGTPLGQIINNLIESFVFN